MDAYMPLLLLSLCANVRGEPLPDAVQRRSDSSVYASQYAREYEPTAYAAIPLHAPIPVQYLRVMPPYQSMLRGAQSVQRPTYALPPQHLYNPYAYAQPYSGTVNYVVYDEESSESGPAPTILYARPNPKGGYSYRRKPSKKRSPPKRPTEEPILIRVHKYRIIRDR